MSDHFKCTYCEIDIEKTGLIIQEMMLQRSITVKELAQSLALSSQAIYKWLRGECLPTLENIVQLSFLFQVPVDELIVRKTVYCYKLPEYYVRETRVIYGSYQ